MAGRFPGAKNLDEFWRNLRAGVESITFFSDEQLRASGVSDAMLEDPQYVKAAGVLDDIELFDAPFFNFTPREAEVTDPQQRLFLECAWQALENAGYVGESFNGSIAVYAGAALSGYMFRLYERRELLDSFGGFRALLGNDKDFLPTWVSYKLDLKGPSVSVQTGCSTALVAIHLACQSLLNYQCDMALSGAVAVSVPHRIGYLHQPGGLDSPDGHCRAFDAEAEGLVSGNGVGIVVLKRLEDAIADRDYIHAVIRGSAVNNDGALKVGFTAPSVQGQAEVIALAQAIAGVKPEDITYVEAHGSATPIGDPIEISALTRAFKLAQKNVCAVGSVKTNIGHADAAAGAAGLIKTVLALQNKIIPPSLHFNHPNPQIDFANSPFYVNSESVAWPCRRVPRLAGVSAFGVGGTNAHVIVEEAMRPPSVASVRPWQLLVLSARTSTALESVTDNLVEWLQQHGEANLADVAYTLQVGRKKFDHRRALVCRDGNDAVEALRTRDARRLLNSVKGTDKRPAVFMLEGVGDHYVDMGGELYRTETVFREQLDRCAQLLMPILQEDIRAVLYPVNASAPDKRTEPGIDLRQMLKRGCAREDAAAQKLNRTSVLHPAVFSIEYALAQLWISFGVRPQSLIGYSLGEYVAACLSGVLTLEDALTLVAQRAKLIEELPSGAMLAVQLAEAEVQPLMGAELSLAAVDGPQLCVVAGPEPAVAGLEQQLIARDIIFRRVQTSHALHSQMMEPIAPRFRQLVASLALKPPRIPYISNVTGTWITDTEATTPDYWVRHLKQSVRFADGLSHLLQKPGQAWLEIGAGQTLCSLIQQHPQLDKAAEQVILPTLPHSYDRQPETALMLNTLAQLWLTDVDVEWPRFHAREQRQRVPLPTYPFERQRYWIGAAEANGSEQSLSTERFSSALYPRQNLRTAYIAPGNRLEQQLAEVWQELFGIEQIGIHDRFLDLGGNSLLATQLVLRLRDTFDLNLSIRAVFEAPTIAQLAVMIELKREAPEAEAQTLAPLLPRVSGTKPLPVSFAQRRLWFMDQLAPVNAAYYLPSAVHLSGPLNLAALKQAFSEIIRRHEVLRTTFVVVDGQPAQVVGPAFDLPLPTIDLQRLNHTEQEACMLDLATQHAVAPFDLSRGPLLRTSLLRINEREHILLAAMHHIVSDGWSLGPLVREMAALYEAFSQGQSSPLPELPIQYADFARWQQQWLAGPQLQEQLAYWKKQLAGHLPLLALPTDKPRPPVQTFNGAHEYFSLSPELTAQIKELSRAEGVTLFMTLVAAFQTLLYRYTGEPDVVVGTPAANRTRREVEGLIGFFVNILVLRTQLSGEPTFRELLQRVNEVALGAYAHQDCPFELLVSELNLARDLSYHPLFQVMFSWNEAGWAQLELQGLEVDDAPMEVPTSQFDLTFTLGEGRERLNGSIQYNTALFEQASISRMMGHYEELLRSVVREPRQRVSRLSLLSEDERQQLLLELNETTVGYEAAATLSQLFERQVERDAGAVAVVSGEVEVAYGELNERANRVARYLQELGVGPEGRVGLLVDRGIEMVVGLLGIIKAGAAYVPLDPSYPLARLKYMLQDAAVSVVLTEQRLQRLATEVATAAGSVGAVLSLDEHWVELGSGENLAVRVDSENLAYIIYTSGSTGVMVSHRNVVRLFAATENSFAFDNSDVWTLFHSYTSDLSVWEMWGALLYGGRLVIVPQRVSRSPEKFYEMLVRERVTVLNQTPSAFRQLCRIDEKSTQSLALRLVIFSGEVLDFASLGQWLRDHGDEQPRLVNMYGTTETTVHVTERCVRAIEDTGSLIGRPIADLFGPVLDQYMELLPKGVPGELYVGGAGVTRGYLGRADLTAERFVPDPFSGRPGARLYRTGDLVRYRAQGEFEYLGRLDRQELKQAARTS
jgi:amino acid adenylation domain-containing protein